MEYINPDMDFLHILISGTTGGKYGFSIQDNKYGVSSSHGFYELGILGEDTNTEIWLNFTKKFSSYFRNVPDWNYEAEKFCS